MTWPKTNSEPQAELNAIAVEGQAIDRISALEAVKLLESLNSDVPAYLPVSLKLASAYEDLKQYKKATDAYDKYIEGYVKFGYPPPDLRGPSTARRLCCPSEGSGSKTTSRKRKTREDGIPDENWQLQNQAWDTLFRVSKHFLR